MSSKGNLICPVYLQFTNTNLESIITTMCEYSAEVANKLNDIHLQYVYLTHSKGDILDKKGKLLGIPRYIIFNDPLDVVLPHHKGFDDYQVIHGSEKKVILHDDSYRIILSLLTQTKNVPGSVPDLSEIISNVINASVWVGDSLDMRYITYYWRDEIESWLQVTIENYDILTRPAGMSTQYISAVTRFFGFIIRFPSLNLQESFRTFSTAWKTIFFLPHDAQNLYLPSDKKVYYIPLELVNITNDDFNNFRQTISRSHQDYKLATQQRKTREDEVFTQSLEDRLHERDALNLPSTVELGFRGATMWDSNQYEAKKLLRQWMTENTQLFRINAVNLAEWKYDYVRWRAHHATHELLHYDHHNGWFFYKESDNEGFYDAIFQAMIYKDKQGRLWYPQDDLMRQIMSTDGILMRSQDYPASGITMKLKTSPLRDILNYHSRITNQEDYKIVNELVNNMHDAIKIHFKWIRIAEQSFRNCLDLEYFVCGDIQKRNYLRDKHEGYRWRLDSDTQDYSYENMHLKWEYRRLDKFFGQARNYNEFYNDKDTSSPAYELRQFCRTQRYWVRKQKEILTNMYNKGAELYSKLSVETRKFVGTRLFYVINDLASSLTKEFYNDIENLQYYSSGWFSLKFQTNSQLEWELRQASERADLAKNRQEWAQKGVEACQGLYGQCWTSGFQLSDFRTGQSKRCYMKAGATRDPIYGNPDDTHDSSGTYYLQKNEGSRGALGCGPGSTKDTNWFRGFYAQERSNKQIKINEAREEVFQTQRKEGIQKLLNYATLVTKDRTLTDVMNYYNSYIPSDPDNLPEDDTLDSLNPPRIYDYIKKAVDGLV